MAEVSLTQEVQSKMNSIANFYAREFYDNTYQVLKKYNVTGRLLNSIKVTWLKANDQYPPRILIIFEEYGNIFETRQPLWTKQPVFKDLVAFVQSRDLTNKNQIPGYKNGAPNLPEHKKAERVAFAIGANMRKTDQWKRKPWRKKAMSATLKEMNQATFEAYTKEIENIMADAISIKQT